MSKLLDKAIIIAVENHSGKKDKAGKDYIFHPLRVMLNVKSEEAKIVAILHDIIEDTKITYDYLKKEGFPETIIEALKNVTRINGESYMHFIDRAKSNPISREVKLADLEDNMNLSRIPNPVKEDYERIKKYKKAKIKIVKLNTAIQKIKDFKSYKYNWNGNGARPFSEKLINKAVDLIQKFRITPEVFPVANDSIQFEWESRDEFLYIELEIFEDKIEIFKLTGTEEKNEKYDELNDDQFKEIEDYVDDIIKRNITIKN